MSGPPSPLVTRHKIAEFVSALFLFLSFLSLFFLFSFFLFLFFDLVVLLNSIDPLSGLTTPSQQLGNCIGKGAFGQVYKGINLDTGEVVAIKQIDLENVTGVELDSVMVRHTLIT